MMHGALINDITMLSAIESQMGLNYVLKVSDGMPYLLQTDDTRLALSGIVNALRSNESKYVAILV